MISKVFYLLTYILNQCFSKLKADIHSEIAFNKQSVKGKGNRLEAYRAQIGHCTFKLSGENNLFSCQSLLKRSDILIEGDNNRIIIEAGGEIRNIKLWIKGNGNEIHIGNEVIFGIISSQIISNVPAAILLSGFSSNYESIIVGINIGGLGTLIASMANLISYKILAREFNDFKIRYLIVFTVLNIALLLILLAVYFLTN